MNVVYTHSSLEGSELSKKTLKDFSGKHVRKVKNTEFAYKSSVE